MQNAEFSPIHPPFEQGVKRFIFGEIAKPFQTSLPSLVYTSDSSSANPIQMKNALYFEAVLPNTPAGKNAQIMDILDYLSNYILMPVVAISTCIFIGWVVKPKTIIDEVTMGGHKFSRQKLYVVMVKFITPVLLTVLLLQALGLIKA